jgi:ubiquinone/menaquinone biosynthesis C-methylase UbiE
VLIDRLIGKQLGHPSGVIGNVVAATMNRRNAYINKATLELLQIKAGDSVLEIGFGGGVALHEMTRLAPDGLVAGVEISDAMLRRGRGKFSGSISEGKVELRKGSASNITYQDSFFDKACAVNSIYFWPDPVAGLKEIYRVLKNGGVFVLSVAPEEQLEKYPPARHGFAIYPDAQLESFLNTAGFVGVRRERREHRPFGAVLFLGNKT